MTVPTSISMARTPASALNHGKHINKASWQPFYFLWSFNAVMRRYWRTSLNAWMQRLTVWLSSYGVYVLGFVGTTFVMILMVRSGAITVGTGFMIFQYLYILQNQIEIITNHMQDVQKAAAGLTRVRQLMEETSGLAEPGTDTLPAGPLALELDGVTFPAAEVPVAFMDPADGEGAMFPTGNVVDDLEVPGVGVLKATLINAGIPTIFLNAEAIGYTGNELQDAINGNPDALIMFETIRAHGAVRMGLIQHIDEAAGRQHTPKVAFVAKPVDYIASSGKAVKASDVDLLVRALSMGKLHHAMMGTAAVAIGAAAAIPGTLVNLAAGGGERTSVHFGHPSGTLRVGAEATRVGNDWVVTKAIMSRSARVLMEGWVRVPGDTLSMD